MGNKALGSGRYHKIPCVRCLRSAITGHSWGDCEIVADKKTTRCVRCFQGGACVPIPESVRDPALAVLSRLRGGEDRHTLKSEIHAIDTLLKLESGTRPSPTLTSIRVCRDSPELGEDVGRGRSRSPPRSLTPAPTPAPAPSSSPSTFCEPSQDNNARIPHADDETQKAIENALAIAAKFYVQIERQRAHLGLAVARVSR